jgi:hypothetical protein
MSARLTFNIASAVVLSATEALEKLAARGEWTRLAEAVVPMLQGMTVGEAIPFDSLGMTRDMFKVTKRDSANYGKVSYAGINAAIKPFGMATRETVDGFRAFYRPSDEKVSARIAAHKAQQEKQRAKQRAKSNKSK